jgi:hypothetical protein
LQAQRYSTLNLTGMVTLAPSTGRPSSSIGRIWK